MKYRFFLYTFGVIYSGLLVFSLFFSEPEFRPWELLYDESTYLFQPNRSISMNVVGDLGRESWVRALQIEKTITFTTDAWGLRNPTMDGPAEIVLLGDSFLVACGSSDADTLSVKLSEDLGATVYNFGVQSIDVPSFFMRDTRFAKQPPRMIIWAPVSRRIRPRPLFVLPPHEEQLSLANHLLQESREVGESFALARERVNRDNQLSVQARYLYNGLLYRVRGHKNLIYPDGPQQAPALALDIEAQGLHVSAANRGVDDTVEMVHYFSQILAAQGIEFIYAPIPESGMIYPELFQGTENIATPSFFDDLLSKLDAAGVNTVDLRPVFSADKTPYLYLRDDSHWNARAIELAAGALAQKIFELNQSSLALVP